MVRPLTILSCVAVFAIATFGDDAPAAHPAVPPAASAPTTEEANGGPDSFIHQEYTFTDPAAGWQIIRQEDHEGIQFANGKEGGLIYASLQPKGLIIDGMGPQLVKALKDVRAKSKVDVVMVPTLEKDKRFDLKIREKYKAEGKVGEQIHLYRSMGPRVIYVIAACTSDDADVRGDVLKTAEDLFAGMKFDKKAFLAQKKIDDQAARDQRKLQSQKQQ